MAVLQQNERKYVWIFGGLNYQILQHLKMLQSWFNISHVDLIYLHF